MIKVVELSVHQLVDFLLRTGDIDNRVFNANTMTEGSRLHALYQSRQASNYLSEYHLKQNFIVDDFSVSLEGRADGIIELGDYAIIDEIKTTVSDLEEFHKENDEWHLGQAKCYGLMFAMEKAIDNVEIRITYIHQLTNEKKVHFYKFSRTKLEKDVLKLIREYLDFYKLIYNHLKIRNDSAEKLEFPYGDFRSGQKKLAKLTYSIADKGGILFAEAPTGIGKTVSTLFPAVKSFALGKNEKVFYLTAKNSGKETAYETAKLMEEQGFKGTYLLITAKDKICFCPGKGCNPDECPFAKGYYTKLKDVITEAIANNSSFNKEGIIEIAKTNALCPFELSLDLSTFADIIICDYNYFFDPLVHLKRFFDTDATNNVALVDEAHNLIERGRNMYTAVVSNCTFNNAKKAVRHLDHKKLKNAQKRITKLFNLFEYFDDGDTEIHYLDDSALRGIDAYLKAASDVNKHHSFLDKDVFMDFFFELNKFYKLYEYLDDTFSLYVKKNGDKIELWLYCIDPRKQLKASLDMVRSKVLFSATLSPTEYYIDMVGADKDDPVLKLTSPFPKENFELLVAPTLSIKYKNRKATIVDVTKFIDTFLKGKVGNYFIYVPSYEYLEELRVFLNDLEYDFYYQEKDMTDDEKVLFLKTFETNPDKTRVGVLIVGGSFGEGIDLVEDRLIGVVVVGVGLPQICYERDLIKEYFNKVEGHGYSYAYTYPGINKVMQAVGRVIRSEKDRGVALIIDDRYLSRPYRELYKAQWSDYKVVTSAEDIEQELNKFWNKQ